MPTPTPSESPKKLTCFHDGDCPLCRLEINAMKKLDKKQQIEWVDIAKDKQALDEAGITYQQAMAGLHVVAHDDKVQDKHTHTNVKAFVALWKQLPYYRHLATVVEKTPLLLPLLERIYRVFARYRLRLTGRKQKGKS